VALAVLCLALLAGLAASGRADAHAVLLASAPEDGTSVATSPPRAELRFSEPFTLVRPEDVSVVGAGGDSVLEGAPRRLPTNARILEAPLRPGLADGTYTLRYRVLSADAHVITGAIVFGVGPGPVGAASLVGAGQGPSETGGWAVTARFLELLGIGGLFGLIAFRWLVWAPAWSDSRGLSPEESSGMLDWMRDRFWGLFAILALGSLIAEAYLLFVKSASLLGTSLLSTLGDPAGVTRALGETPFGSQVQLRAALLVVLFATGLVQSAIEGQPVPDKARQKVPVRPAGRPVAAVLMAVAALVVIGSISTQGHASQAPGGSLSVVADAAHVGAAAIWIAGLLMTLATIRRAPRVAPEGGPAVAARVLARFSRVALVAVGVALVTGTLRTIAELSDPAELWQTGHGQTIVIKLAILCPIAFLAFRNRRIVTALRAVSRPNRPTLALVHRGVGVELALSLVIILVASLLVGQVPGRLD
jgi:copper transport protein